MRARSQGPTSELLNHLTLQADETKRWLSIGWCFLVRTSMTRTTRHGAGKRHHTERIHEMTLHYRNFISAFARVPRSPRGTVVVDQTRRGRPLLSPLGHGCFYSRH